MLEMRHQLLSEVQFICHSLNSYAMVSEIYVVSTVWYIHRISNLMCFREVVEVSGCFSGSGSLPSQSKESLLSTSVVAGSLSFKVDTKKFLSVNTVIYYTQTIRIIANKNFSTGVSTEGFSHLSPYGFYCFVAC